MKTQVFYSPVCPGCGRAPAAPFRAYDPQGHIVLGCINEFHTGHLVTPSASAAWHARPEAKDIRRLDKVQRMGGVTQFARVSV